MLVSNVDDFAAKNGYETDGNGRSDADAGSAKRVIKTHARATSHTKVSKSSWPKQAHSGARAILG